MQLINIFLAIFDVGLFLMLPLGVISLGVIIHKSAQMSDAEERNRFKNRILKRFAIAFVVFWLGATGSTAIARAHRRNQFYDLANKNLPSMTLVMNGQPINITKPEDIATFFKLIQNAKTVGAHHSHPTTDFVITFPNVGEIYALGPDSNTADEYWFKLSDGPQLGFGEKGATLMQIYSPELTNWLRIAHSDTIKK